MATSGTRLWKCIVTFTACAALLNHLTINIESVHLGLIRAKMSDVAVKLYLRANGSRTHCPEEACSGLWALFSFLGQEGGWGEKRDIPALSCRADSRITA